MVDDVQRGSSSDAGEAVTGMKNDEPTASIARFDDRIRQLEACHVKSEKRLDQLDYTIQVLLKYLQQQQQQLECWMQREGGFRRSASTASSKLAHHSSRGRAHHAARRSCSSRSCNSSFAHSSSSSSSSMSGNGSSSNSSTVDGGSPRFAGDVGGGENRNRNKSESTEEDGTPQQQRSRASCKPGSANDRPVLLTHKAGASGTDGPGLSASSTTGWKKSDFSYRDNQTQHGLPNGGWSSTGMDGACGAVRYRIAPSGSDSMNELSVLTRLSIFQSGGGGVRQRQGSLVTVVSPTHTSSKEEGEERKRDGSVAPRTVAPALTSVASGGGARASAAPALLMTSESVGYSRATGPSGLMTVTPTTSLSSTENVHGSAVTVGSHPNSLRQSPLPSQPEAHLSEQRRQPQRRRGDDSDGEGKNSRTSSSLPCTSLTPSSSMQRQQHLQQQHPLRYTSSPAAGSLSPLAPASLRLEEEEEEAGQQHHYHRHHRHHPHGSIFDELLRTFGDTGSGESSATPLQDAAETGNRAVVSPQSIRLPPDTDTAEALRELFAQLVRSTMETTKLRGGLTQLVHGVVEERRKWRCLRQCVLTQMRQLRREVSSMGSTVSLLWWQQARAAASTNSTNTSNSRARGDAQRGVTMRFSGGATTAFKAEAAEPHGEGGAEDTPEEESRTTFWTPLSTAVAAPSHQGGRRRRTSATDHGDSVDSLAILGGEGISFSLTTAGTATAAATGIATAETAPKAAHDHLFRSHSSPSKKDGGGSGDGGDAEVVRHRGGSQRRPEDPIHPNALLSPASVATAGDEASSSTGVETTAAAAARTATSAATVSTAASIPVHSLSSSGVTPIPFMAFHECSLPSLLSGGAQRGEMASILHSTTSAQNLPPLAVAAAHAPAGLRGGAAVKEEEEDDTAALVPTLSSASMHLDLALPSNRNAREGEKVSPSVHRTSASEVAPSLASSSSSALVRRSCTGRPPQRNGPSAVAPSLPRAKGVKETVSPTTTTAGIGKLGYASFSAPRCYLSPAGTSTAAVVSSSYPLPTPVTPSYDGGSAASRARGDSHRRRRNVSDAGRALSPVLEPVPPQALEARGGTGDFHLPNRTPPEAVDTEGKWDAEQQPEQEQAPSRSSDSPAVDACPFPALPLLHPKKRDSVLRKSLPGARRWKRQLARPLQSSQRLHTAQLTTDISLVGRPRFPSDRQHPNGHPFLQDIEGDGDGGSGHPYLPALPAPTPFSAAPPLPTPPFGLPSAFSSTSLGTLHPLGHVASASPMTLPRQPHASTDVECEMASRTPSSARDPLLPVTEQARVIISSTALASDPTVPTAVAKGCEAVLCLGAALDGAAIVENVREREGALEAGAGNASIRPIISHRVAPLSSQATGGAPNIAPNHDPPSSRFFSGGPESPLLERRIRDAEKPLLLEGIPAVRKGAAGVANASPEPQPSLGTPTVVLPLPPCNFGSVIEAAAAKPQKDGARVALNGEPHAPSTRLRCHAVDRTPPSPPGSSPSPNQQQHQQQPRQLEASLLGMRSSSLRYRTAAHAPPPLSVATLSDASFHAMHSSARMTATAGSEGLWCHTSEGTEVAAAVSHSSTLVMSHEAAEPDGLYTASFSEHNRSSSTPPLWEPPSLVSCSAGSSIGERAMQGVEMAVAPVMKSAASPPVSPTTEVDAMRHITELPRGEPKDNGDEGKPQLSSPRRRRLGRQGEQHDGHRCCSLATINADAAPPSSFLFDASTPVSIVSTARCHASAQRVASDTPLHYGDSSPACDGPVAKPSPPPSPEVRSPR